MTRASPQLDLPPNHGLAIALVCPQIAPNTGNIARLCVATGTPLHLVRPLGFILSDKDLRRSAMDYWPRLQLTVHDDLAAFVLAMGGARVRPFSTRAHVGLWDADFAVGDVLVFGSETAGLPSVFLDARFDQAVRIPQASGERCLNLSTAVGVGFYEALRSTLSKFTDVGESLGRGEMR